MADGIDKNTIVKPHLKERNRNHRDALSSTEI